jgi:hypothetical protein
MSGRQVCFTQGSKKQNTSANTIQTSVPHGARFQQIAPPQAANFYGSLDKYPEQARLEILDRPRFQRIAPRPATNFYGSLDQYPGQTRLEAQGGPQYQQFATPQAANFYGNLGKYPEEARLQIQNSPGYQQATAPQAKNFYGSLNKYPEPARMEIQDLGKAEQLLLLRIKFLKDNVAAAEAQLKDVRGRLRARMAGPRQNYELRGGLLMLIDGASPSGSMAEGNTTGQQ